jgi:hypothetical protein
VVPIVPVPTELKRSVCEIAIDSRNAGVKSPPGSPGEDCLGVQSFLFLEKTRGRTKVWRGHYGASYFHARFADGRSSELANMAKVSLAFDGSAIFGILTP